MPVKRIVFVEVPDGVDVPGIAFRSTAPGVLTAEVTAAELSRALAALDPPPNRSARIDPDEDDDPDDTPELEGDQPVTVG